ncbi:MAG: hypothetical protein CTY31_02185 [Hyphomicrobium sp.]|nr:MAG: hypothetical protein CTY39_00475 [Hyphomicrobium sp.]PPD01584.1 MAG: hypothetical protein CTY31_02185 [Hyphomicrobium sp.]
MTSMLGGPAVDAHQNDDAQTQMQRIEAAYREAPWLQRLMVTYRPTICPTEPILRHVPANMRVLDVGCGIGLILITMALERRITSGIGIDVNGKAIDVARAAAKKLFGVDVRFLQRQSISELGDSPFDVVTVIDVMHHVEPNAQHGFFFECANAVAPGGLLIYKDMGRRPLWMSLFNRLHDLILAHDIIHYVPLSDIKSWANQHDLILIEECAYRRIAYAHELLVFRRKDLS